jgi:hypothetical protein
VLITLIVPLALPVVNAWRARHNEVPLPPTYLPALEGPRKRDPFDAVRVSDLRYLQPGSVVIGDSMAGSRIDERRLGELAGKPVAPLLQPGSGSAFWYLALKNWVIPSGITPRLVLIFFRDGNLTDVMFRLDQQFRWALDQAALDREDELDAVIRRRLGPLQQARIATEQAIGVDRARTRLEPALAAFPAWVMIPSRRRRAELTTQLNERFGLDHLRRMEAADVEAAEPDVNFARDVDRSVLPLMLRDARQAGLTLCFVRVQRRPIANRPPPQSPGLRRYIDSLRSYVTEQGAFFHDDTGDPAMTLDLYADGDHLARRARRFYTENLYARLRTYFH